MPKIETMFAHAGLDRNDPTGSMNTPVYYSSTYRHPAIGQTTGFDYSRTSNPTRKALEDCVASLEHGTKGYAFASGMASISAVLSLFGNGDHIIVSEDLYGGTYRLLEAIFRRFGLTADFVDTGDMEAVMKAATGATRALLVETPSNPLLRISDIASLSSWARARGILTIVDNTFMTPYLQKPLDHGADIVVHSGTKFIGGHNDVVCGLAVARDEALCEAIGFAQNSTGGVLSPHDSFLVLRGIKTLSVRLDRAQFNACRIAGMLSDHTSVARVYYPGLSSHTGHDIHRAQASGPGAMVSFRVRNAAAAERVINRVRTISFAESLGGVESLITYPVVQTHGAIPEPMRERIGVTDDLLRLSVGIEHADDLIDDLLHALREG